MKLCIFGSRTAHPTPDEIDEVLESVMSGAWHDYGITSGMRGAAWRNIKALICGMAKGADEAGYRWAKERGVWIDEYRANWNRHGKAAGPIRNEVMAKECDIAVGFWDGQSSGTANMAARLLVLRKPVHLVEWRRT